MKSLATKYNTSLSNIYKIINASKITTINTNLKESIEYSYTVLTGKRKNKKTSNNSKLIKAQPFINMVIKEVKTNKYSSIDETINHLKLHHKDTLKGFTTICTSTMYNYVHEGIIELKPIDLPRMLRRKHKTKDKTYTNPKTRGTSIEERPECINSLIRTIFTLCFSIAKN